MQTSVATVLGIAACLLALGEAAAGALLSRRSSGPARIQRPLVVLFWTLALATLSLGLAYLRFDAGLPFEGAWRGGFTGMFSIAAALHLVLEILRPGDRRNFSWALVSYGVAGGVALVGWGTGFWFEGVTSLVPFTFQPGPGFLVLLWGSVTLCGTIGWLALRGWRRLSGPDRRRTAWLTWGVAGTAIAAVLLGLLQLAVPVDAFWVLLAAAILLVTVPWGLSARGLFSSSMTWGHFGLVVLWSLGLALVQGILFRVLSPPLSPSVAVPVTLLTVLVVGYLVLPASRRTLDSLDALLMARRQGKRLLESFLARFGTTLDLDHIAGQTVDFLVREYGFSWARCYLATEDGRFREVPGAEGEEAVPMPGVQDLLPLAVLPLWVDSRPSSPEEVPESSPEGQLRRLGAQVAMPLVREGEIYGLVLAGSLASGAEIEDADRGLLRSLATHLSVLFQNARHFQSATTDNLTGLLQRGYLMKRLTQEMDREARHRRGLTVMMADIDHFKSVNDRFGHPEGDRVLQEVARRIRTGLRSTDLAGRYGGEEFLLVLPDTPGEVSRQVADRLRRSIQAAPIGLAGRVTISIGVARWQGHASPEALIQQADLALYRAKRNGRDRVEVHGGAGDRDS